MVGTEKLNYGERVRFLLLIPSLLSACAGVEGDSADPCTVAGNVCTVVGTGQSGFNGDGLAPTETELYWPSAVRFNADGELLLADLNNFRVRTIGADGTMTTLVGTGEHLGSTDGAVATETPIDYPADIRFRDDGSYFVAAIHEGRVLHVDTEGVLHWYVGTGTLGYAGDGGLARDAQLSAASGIALDDDGTIYVADTENHCIRAVTAEGVIRTLSGRGLPGFAGDHGPAEGALLHRPTALEVAEGILYVADSGNHAIRAIDLASNTISTVAGLGVGGFDGDGGLATEALLQSPEGLTLGEDGTLWIADSLNNRIRHIDAAGIIRTVAGTGDYESSGDGVPALEASFAYPVDLAFHEGDLYVSDMVGAVVRRVHAP